MAASKLDTVLNVIRKPNSANKKIERYRDMMLKDVFTDYVIHAGGEQIRCH